MVKSLLKKYKGDGGSPVSPLDDVTDRGPSNTPVSRGGGVKVRQVKGLKNRVKCGKDCSSLSTSTRQRSHHCFFTPSTFGKDPRSTCSILLVY